MTLLHELERRTDDGFAAVGADVGALTRQLAEALARIRSGQSRQLAALLQARIGGTAPDTAAAPAATTATGAAPGLPAGFRPGGGGIDADTGKWIGGWAHVQQSIRMILTTLIGSRVMRRDFGSDVPRLIAAPMTDGVILAVYVAVATALDRWEPRFKLTQVEFAGTLGGRLDLVLTGVWMPRGHLGDRTPANDNQGLRRLVVTHPGGGGGPERQWLAAA